MAGDDGKDPTGGAWRSAEREFGHALVPAWRRATRGEQRWPAAVTLLALILLQVTLPEPLTLGPRWVLPGVQAAILVVLTVANPRRIDRDAPTLRILGLLLIAVASLANAVSVVRLVAAIVGGGGTENAAALLTSGGVIWTTNVLTFAVWYWELDRGGPADRAHGVDPYPDFLFPQMSSPELAPRDWEPRFADYLYVSFTNATAFSPTDTLPLSRWAKFAMMLQSAISLATAALVVARAINVLG